MGSGAKVLPPEPGAYVIAAPPPLAGHPALAKMRTPLYVGHTDDLRRRMREQLRARLHLMPTFSRMVFIYSRTSSVTAARQVEQALIRAFGPSDNQRNSIKMKQGEPVPAGRPRTTKRSKR